MLMLLVALSLGQETPGTEEPLPQSEQHEGVAEETQQDLSTLCRLETTRYTTPRFPSSERGTRAECEAKIYLGGDGRVTETRFEEGACPAGFQPTVASATARFRYRVPAECPLDTLMTRVNFIFVPSGQQGGGTSPNHTFTEEALAQVVQAYTTTDQPGDTCSITATVHGDGSISGLTRNMRQCLVVVGATDLPAGLTAPTTCRISAQVANHRGRKWTVTGCGEDASEAALEVARSWGWHNPYGDKVPYELDLTFDPSPQ
jgi:hypothetical protein